MTQDDDGSAPMLGSQADEPCLCTFAARTVGDGCERCNPQMAIELLKEQVKELALTAEERGAIEHAATELSDGYLHGPAANAAAVILRNLLDRLA